MNLSTLTNGFRSLHNDEDGLEAVQVVMIVAIAALILIGAMQFGQEIFTWANQKFTDLQGEKITAGGGGGA